MLSVAMQEPWFANFMLVEARGYRSRAIREIQPGAWQVGILFDSNGNVVTPATVHDTRGILMRSIWAQQREVALLAYRDAEVNEGYVQFGILDKAAVRLALLENSRIIVRPGPFSDNLEARNIIVRPPVAGNNDVQASLEYFDREMFTANGGVMTGPLDVIEIEAGSPRSQAVNRGYVDSLVLGITRFIGRLNAEIDEVTYTDPSGITPNPGRLIPASQAGGGAQIVVELPGVMPDDSVLPGAALAYGDYLLSDATAWYHFPLQAQSVTGSMVGLAPSIFGRSNVQDALQQTEIQVNTKVNRHGDTMTSTLLMDVGIAGLPSIYIRKPSAGGSPAACLQILGAGAAEAIRCDGDVILNDGILNAMGGFVMSRQFYLGVDINCGYLLGPDAGSGGLWRNNSGQMVLRRPPGQDFVYSENSDIINRYRMLDERDLVAIPVRSPAFKYDLANNIDVPPSISIGGNWISFWSGNYAIPRGGNSLLLIDVSINLDIPLTLPMILAGMRCNNDSVQRQIFCYRVGASGPVQAAGRSSGLSAQFYLEVTGTNPAITVEVASLETQNGYGPPFLILGGSGNPARSQMLITDLGPR